MKNLKIGKLFAKLLALLYLFSTLLFSANYFANAKKWASHPVNDHLYSAGSIVHLGEIYDRNGVRLAYTENNKRKYAEGAETRKATIHILGDDKGFISTGVQNALWDKISGYSAVNGLYTYSGEPNNATLTIDSDISVTALRALGKNSGTIAVCNYKTGELLCAVSTPTFDIADEAQFKNAVNGSMGSVFVNRFLSSTYTPGSTFKIVTAAAAIETNGNLAFDTAFTCDYGTVIEGENLSCVGRHNNVTLKPAFSHSCNAYFASTALSLGRETMQKYAEMFGFNKSFSLDGIRAARSSFSVADSREIDFGWSGIGQHTDLMNPLQYLCAVSAIANGGSYREPYILKDVTDSTGKNVYTGSSKAQKMLKADTANSLSSLMEYAVTDNYKRSSFGGLPVCGKTGTAEVGGGVENSLFVGFLKDESCPVAFVVVIEGGGEGRVSALSAANKVLQTTVKKFS